MTPGNSALWDLDRPEKWTTLEGRRRLNLSLHMVDGHLTGAHKIVKVKLATIVEGDPKAPFSIATTPRCRGGRYSIQGMEHTR